MLGITVAHGFIWWVLVGLIAGFLTGKIMRVAEMASSLTSLSAPSSEASPLHIGGGFIVTIIIAVVGAAILTFPLRLLTGKRA
jgi:uncharacterized membrane protein YeaQ/YmgE (transglycosylase-associated protein family)